MLTDLTKEDLIEFETEMAACFDASMIRAPVHLYNGNEEQMIAIFKNHQISEEDWVLGSWRSHYQCLLKGVPRDKLKKAILDGRSISLCFKEQRVLCSGIVTGVLPIAVGIALNIKRENLSNRVFCFKYSRNHELPIHFIVEDNGKSVCTNTRATWNQEVLTYEGVNDEYVTYYKYKLDKYPHAGAGKRVQF